jgi:hypothetical protein
VSIKIPKYEAEYKIKSWAQLYRYSIHVPKVVSGGLLLKRNTHSLLTNHNHTCIEPSILIKYTSNPQVYIKSNNDLKSTDMIKNLHVPTLSQI